MFADDTKCYKAMLKLLLDKDMLQKSIHDMTEWTTIWLLEFNSLKCKIMHLGLNNPNFDYDIEECGCLHTLGETTAEKDLGVIVDPLLTFENHINTTVNKARKISGLIIRTMTYKSPEVMVPLFKALIRPILEYANPVWNPHQRKLINLIEQVQRNFTKAIIGMKKLEYEDRLKALKLPTLEYRRFRGDMIETFKICTGLYDPTTTDTLFTFVPADNLLDLMD